MTIQLARDILGRLGGGRIAHDAADGGVLVAELRLNGCIALPLDEAGAEADILIVDLAGEDPAGRVAVALARVTARDLALVGAGRPRAEIEALLFAGGWRRHPAAMQAHEFGAFDAQTTASLNLYQRLPQDAPAAITEDALRHPGPLADARIARYAMAAHYVRTGDRVLDCRSGAGDGLAVLAASTRGGAFVGVEPELALRAYAQACHGGAGMDFVGEDPEALAGVPDHSIDLIACLDSLETAEDPEAMLAAFKRVLKPDGRIVVGATAPFAPAVTQAMAQLFVLEARHLQLALAGRSLWKGALDGPEQGEWTLIVAGGNPFECDEALAAAYVHPAFGARGAAPTVADFGASYDNPYLYRSLIQMGERMSDDEKLIRMALMVAKSARADSPDRGGAIAVLGYRVLEGRGADAAPEIMALIDSYLEAAVAAQDPHAQRWRLSLEFLAARLMEMTGDRDAALDWYAKAGRRDWRGFSPLLATKTIAAGFYEGRLHLFAGDEASARRCFEHGLREALAAAAWPPDQVVGDFARPLPFGMQELAEVVDMGAQCATALANLHLWKRSPGLFWSTIDTRRFGLASWAKDLERENERLRAA